MQARLCALGKSVLDRSSHDLARLKLVDAKISLILKRVRAEFAARDVVEPHAVFRESA